MLLRIFPFRPSGVGGRMLKLRGSPLFLPFRSYPSSHRSFRITLASRRDHVRSICLLQVFHSFNRSHSLQVLVDHNLLLQLYL